MNNPEYKWTEELKNELISYIEDEVGFNSHKLAQEWGMHHMTVAKRIREVCHELGYTAKYVTSAKKNVEVNKTPTELDMKSQEGFIQRYANKTVGAGKTLGKKVNRYKVDCVTEDGISITLTIKAVSEEQAIHEVQSKNGNLKPVRVLSKDEDKHRRSKKSLLNKGNL